MTNQELKSTRIKDYFIAATMELVEKQNKSRPTARDIADLAGYSPATIYKYFGSLDRLILATADRYAETINGTIREKIDDELVVLEKIKLAYRVFSDFFIDSPNAFKMIFVNEYTGEAYNPELLPNFFEMEKNRREMFASLASEYGLSAGEGLRLESVLSSNMFGPLYMWVSNRLPVSPEDLRETIERNILFVLDTFRKP